MVNSTGAQASTTARAAGTQPPPEPPPPPQPWTIERRGTYVTVFKQKDKGCISTPIAQVSIEMNHRQDVIWFTSDNLTLEAQLMNSTAACALYEELLAMLSWDSSGYAMGSAAAPPSSVTFPGKKVSYCRYYPLGAFV
jgi:hypothetical protein